ncbi:MAG: sulfite exporter TauE/SafE family protein [Gemmataceae bacterium]
MYDSLGKYGLLCLSALAAGIINSVAGGGTLLTFPALLAALGPGGEVLANTTSTVALVPGSLAGVGGYWREMQQSRHWVKLLIGPCLIGGLVGGLLLTRLPTEWFAELVPWLILTAATLFLLQPAISRWIDIGGSHHPTLISKIGLVIFQFFVAVYGGYFGAGIGILMISSLSLMGIGDIHRINALKTFLAFCINGITVVVFIVQDQVIWHYAVAMMGFAILGGYVGAHTARRMDRDVVRWIVVAIGFGLAFYYFYTQYFQTRV